MYGVIQLIVMVDRNKLSSKKKKQKNLSQTASLKDFSFYFQSFTHMTAYLYSKI